MQDTGGAAPLAWTIEIGRRTFRIKQHYRYEHKLSSECLRLYHVGVLLSMQAVAGSLKIVGTL